jgi:hypothetical protein
MWYVNDIVIAIKKFTGCILYSLEKQPIVMLKATVIE